MIRDAARPSIRRLHEKDLEEADRIFRRAFGTQFGLLDPVTEFPDVGHIMTRFRADPSLAVGAEVGGRLAGTAYGSLWGTLGVLGPVSVRPEMWDQGLGARLTAAMLELLDEAGTEHVGLFTFAESGKHVGLYRKFGFWPQSLTSIWRGAPVAATSPGLTRLRSSMSPAERAEADAACRECAGKVFEGLDLGREIAALDKQGLGDVVLLEGDAGLRGFAICHIGGGTEAGAGSLYVKFGCVAPAPDAERSFQLLLGGCEDLATERRMQRVLLGVNAARESAYRVVADRGYRIDLQGVVMCRPHEAVYNTPDRFVIDDWR